MDNFKTIYKILKYLEATLDCEEINIEPITAEQLKINANRWEQLLIMLQDDGYIKGLICMQSVSDDKRHIVEPIKPQITLKGLEYLANNSFMKKASDALKGIIDCVS